MASWHKDRSRVDVVTNGREEAVAAALPSRAIVSITGDSVVRGRLNALREESGSSLEEYGSVLWPPGYEPALAAPVI